MRILATFVILLTCSLATQAQTTFNWKRDTIYAGPGGGAIATVTPLPSDATPPGAPSSLGTTGTTATTVSLSWTGSSDSGGSGLAGYKIYRQKGSGANLPVGTVNSSTTGFTDQPLEPSTAYSFTLVAFDAAQNHSSASNSVNVTTSAASSDTAAPSVPASLAVSLLTRNSVRVTWNPSTDIGGSGIQGYKVYRDSTLVSGSTPVAASHFDQSGLSYTTAYAYKVLAVDNANNASAQTNAVNITTGRSVILEDNFNRADSQSLGSGWSALFNSLRVRGAGAEAAAVSGGAVYGSLVDTTIPATFKLTSELSVGSAATGWGGILLYAQPVNLPYEDEYGWHDDIHVYGYVAIVNPGDAYLTLYYCDFGLACDSWDSSSLGGTPLAGKLSVETNATNRTIKVYWNDSLKINLSASGVDSAYGMDTMYGKPGLYGFAVTSHSVRFDNFIIESN